MSRARSASCRGRVLRVELGSSEEQEGSEERVETWTFELRLLTCPDSGQVAQNQQTNNASQQFLLLSGLYSSVDTR